MQLARDAFVGEDMRILVVTGEFHHGHIGGAGEYAYNVCRELTNLGHEVDVIASSVYEHLESMQNTPFAIYQLKFPSPLRIIGMFKWSVAAFVCSTALMRRKHYDVLYVHHPEARLYPLFWRSQIPMIASIHKGWALTDVSISRPSKLIEFLWDLAVIGKCKKVIVLNKHFEFQLRRWGIPGEKIHYIPNGVDCSEFIAKKNSEKLRHKLGVPQDATVILFVGRLTKHKGVENLLEALRIVYRRMPRPVWAIIVGDGPLKNSLIRASRNLSNIVFTGEISRQELLSVYAESDLLVTPSQGGEGMPTVILEGMASGLPVVATRIPGTTEIVKSDFGRLVDAEAVQQLANALLDMISDQVSLNQMGKIALLSSRRFDWSAIAARIAEVFKFSLET